MIVHQGLYTFTHRAISMTHKVQDFKVALVFSEYKLMYYIKRHPVADIFLVFIYQSSPEK